MPRTVLAMRRCGLRPVSATWPRFAEARDIYSFLREAADLPYYAIQTGGRLRRRTPTTASRITASSRLAPTVAGVARMTVM